MNWLYQLSDFVDEKTHPRNYQIFLIFVFASIAVGAILSNATPDQLKVAGIGIPPLCPFRVLTGLDCPVCGISRSLVFAFHGQWRASYLMHMWGIPLALLVVTQIPYRLYLFFGGRPFHYSPRFKRWASRTVYLSLGLPWAVKLAIHFL